MSTEKKVIVVIGISTGGTVRTIPRIVAMDDSTDRKKSMSPLEKEVRMMVIAIANGCVEGPINIMSRFPGTRGEDILFHWLIIDDVMDGGYSTTSNRYSRDGEFAHTGWKDEDVRGWKSLGESMAGEGVGRDISKSWGGE